MDGALNCNAACLARYKDRATSLRRLLVAESLVEFSAEHCERMGKRLRDLSMTLRGAA
jgi:hypothetical protein